MFKIMFLLSITTIILNADDNVMLFYKKALETLQFDKIYSLYKESSEISRDSVIYDKYLNFSLETSYSKTKTDDIPNPFYTTDFSISDKIDIFGKSSYAINEIALELKTKKNILNIEKEYVFMMLVDMIAQYQKSKQKLILHKSLLKKQLYIYKKLKKLQLVGSISKIDLLRFKNALTILKTKTINENINVDTMKKQLEVYAPNQNIPYLSSQELSCTEESFLSQNQHIKLNDIRYKKLIVKSKALLYEYMPSLSLEASYENIGDPTSYGNSYSLHAHLHIPLNISNYKQSEAQRVDALSIKSKSTEYKLKRQNEYIKRVNEYTNAKKQYKVLNENLNDYIESEEITKKAFLKQYINFTTYFQVLTQSLHIKERIIELKYQEIAQAIILNSISTGEIYD